MDNYQGRQQITDWTVHLMLETTLVTTQKRVIPTSMPGLLANRGPMAEQTFWVITKVQQTGWQKNVMMGEGKLELTWPIEFHPRPTSTIVYLIPIMTLSLVI